MSFFNKMIAVELPTPEEIVENEEKQQKEFLQEVEQLKKQAPPNCLSEIRIYLLKNNDCKITINVTDDIDYEHGPNAIARMLYSLNEGEMKGIFAKIITNQANKNFEDVKLGLRITEEWEKLYKENDDKACIQPTKVL